MTEGENGDLQWHKNKSLFNCKQLFSFPSLKSVCF